MKSKKQTCKLSCCKMKISITPNLPEVFKELNSFVKGVEGRATRGGISRKTLSPEADKNQLNPKVHSHS